MSCPFCITTVDTIFDEVEFAEYVRCLKTTTSSGLFPVTDYVDDDSPLYIKGDLDWLNDCSRDLGLSLYDFKLLCGKDNAELCMSLL